MPHVYRHDRMDLPEPRPFECELECRRCGAPTSSYEGSCKRRVCLWLPFCWHHSRSLLGVQIKESRVIPGTTGMYATRDFAEGDMVAPYLGERLTEASVRRRYGFGELALGPYLLHSTDAACVRGVGSASNGAFGGVPKARANVVFNPTTHQYGVEKGAGTSFQGRALTRSNLGVKHWSWATRAIRSGEEIVADYGVSLGYEGAFVKRQAECARRSVACDRTKRRSTRRAR